MVRVAFGACENHHWRLCFVWKTDGLNEVEIVDYH